MADEQTLDTNPQEQQANEALAGDELAARVQSLEEQLAAAQDQSLRMAADLQNVRRRAEQDVEKAHKFALEKFANDLLPVVDSLERGLELTSAVDEASKAIREGMELTLKLFDVLGPRYKNRNGGYLRILKYGFRQNDNAPMALVELVDRPDEAVAVEAGE